MGVVLLHFLALIFACCFAVHGYAQTMSDSGYRYPGSLEAIPDADYIDKLSIEFDPSLESDIKTNVSLYLQGLSLPSVSGLNRHKNLMIDETLRALRALGYYQAQVDIYLQQKGAELIASVTIVLGDPVKITHFSLRLLGEGGKDQSFLGLKGKYAFKEGQIFHHGRYEFLKSELNSLALQKGYFDALWLKHEVKIDIEKKSVDIRLIFDLKKRFLFGKIKVEPPRSSAESIIRELADFSEGEPYSARRVADYSVDLSSSSYFKSVIVRPLVDRLDNGYVPMEVKVVPKSSDIFKVGGGFSTDVRFRGQLYWTRPWINRWGHSVTSGFEGSEVQQQYSLAYLIPIKDPVNDYFNIVGGVIRKNINNTDSRVITLQGQRLQKFESDWKRILFLRWQRDDYRQANQQTVSDLIIPGVTYSFTKSEGALDPYHGYQQIFTLELSDPTWGSGERLMKGRTFTKLIRQAGITHRMSTRLDLGAIAVDNVYSVPSSMRFFAGGDQSIRGYGYEAVAPRNVENELIGGRYLVVGSLEYSYPVFKNWRLALFLDSGIATNDFTEKLSTGTGLGVRWMTPIGPIKLDFGFPVSESDPINNWRFHFTVGPEL